MVVLLLSFAVIGFYAAGEVAAEGNGSASLVKEAGQKVESTGPAISQDRAVQIAREMFPDLLEGKDVDVQLDDYYVAGGSRIWRLDWSDPAPGGRRMEHFNIGIDADSGALANLYYYNPAAGLEGGVTPLTEEAARQKAEEYARKYCPAEFGRTRPVEREYFNYYPYGMMKNAYTFYWERLENGIPVEGDGINVGVDLFSGRLISFNANWHRDAVFPQPGSLPEGLENKVLKELGLILCYQVPEGLKTNLSGVPEAIPVYRLNSPGMLRISPGSGEALTWDGKVIPLNQYKRFSSLPEPATGGAFEEGSGTVDRPARKISQAEAQKAARDFFRKIGIDREVIRSGGGSSGGGVFYDEFWNYSLADEKNWKPGQRKQINVGIDAFTGEVRNYNAFTEYAGQGADSAQKITCEVARKRAVDFIRLISPEKLGQVVEEQQDEGYAKFEEGYHFNFVRLVNGIPFLRDGIRIYVSNGGEITSYYCNWHAVRFPSAAGLITREEAEKVFQEKMSLKPAYFFPLEGENARPGKQPALALMFDSYRDVGIDARTGQLVAVDMMLAQPEGKPGAEIPPGHWAATPLSVLADSGLLPAEGFDPDGPVSRRDAVRVLMSAVENGYSSYQPFGRGGEKVSFTDVSQNDRDYTVIQTAVRRGILAEEDSFSPDQPVLREDLAVWLVRALGYGEVAEMPAKIELKAADADQVSEKARNYVAIAWGLGLIKGDENDLFRPVDQATWAELASLVTRTAPRLRSVREW